MKSPIPFERDFEPAYGACVQLSALVRRVVANNPGPFTFTGTGTYIIGRGNVAVIDPGPMDDAHLAALEAALEGETVSHILITHTHHDHSPLSGPLKQRTGGIIHAYGAHKTSGAESGEVELDAAADHAFRPDVAIAHGQTIEGDGWTISGVFTPGHTANHMAFALEQEKALFVGDHVMAWSTSVIAPPDGNMADYMASLDLLLGRDDEIFWPTHGGPIKDPKPFVEAFIEHRNNRERAILDALDRGYSTIAEMVREIYAQVDPKLYPAAGASVLAHMEHLAQKREIKADGPVGLNARYRRA